MLVSRANLTAHVAAKDNVRPALAGILLDSHGATSADGYVLLHTPYPVANPDDYPASGAGVAAWRPDKPIIVPAEAASQFLKANKPARIAKSVPILENVVVSAANNGRDNSHVRLSVTDLENEQSVTVQTTDATFPDYHAVIPTAPAHYSITLDLERLVPLCRALMQAGVKGARFSFQEREGCPVKIEPAAWDHDHDGTIALIMPMNSKEPR